MSYVFGWITPQKEFIDCGRFEHLEVLSKHESMCNRPEIAELISSAEEAERGCQALVDAGEHGEWHSYEMALDDVKDAVWKLAMEEGYVRVCSDGSTIHFEMNTNVMPDMRQFCVDFADDRQMAYQFEVVK